MQDARAVARESLSTFVEAWIAGEPEAASGVLDPAVRWWTPLSDSPAEGPTHAWAALGAVIAGAAHPIQVSALLVNDDGTRGVIELRAGTEVPQPAALTTTVVTLFGGKVLSGATYSDVGTGPAGVA